MSGGPVFGKPSSSNKKSKLSSYDSRITTSNPFETNDEPTGPPNKRSSLRTSASTEAHLRIVSLQIGEREAVNTIRSICQESIDAFGVSAKLEDITDPLSGILIMGNLLKRVGQEKLYYEDTLKRRVKEFEDTINHKNELMEQMETMIANLQAEVAQAEGHLQEEKVRHSHRVTILTKEIQTIRADMMTAKTENEKLRQVLETQEKALMNIPRLEEQYMRNARSAVRQSEAANTLNRIEFKKMEEEVKNLSFWKNKAKSMEETIHKQKQEIEGLEQQHRTTFSKYQNLMRTTKQLHETMYSGTGPNNGTSHQVPTSNLNATMKKSRPVSAPSTRRLQSSTSTNSLLKNSTSKTSNQPNVLNNNQEGNTSNINDNLSHTGSNTSHTGSYNNNSTNNMNDAVKSAQAADEIIRLRGELRKKDRLIVKLSQRLSFARAHPLLATTGDHTHHVAHGDNNVLDDDSNDEDDVKDDDANKKKKLDEALMRSSNPLIGTALEDLPYMQDVWEESSLARAEEEALQQERERKALELQLHFSAFQLDRKLSGPPHIVAIRQARNFGKVIDDVVKERDQQFLQQKLATSHRDIVMAKS